MIPPADPHAGMGDGQLSSWLLPDVGNYSNLACRSGRGALPTPTDQNTPCPECCSVGQWDSTNLPNGTQDWHWTPDEQWGGSTLFAFSSVCWSFATAMADMAAERGEPQVPMGLIGSCESLHHIHRCLALVLL